MIIDERIYTLAGQHEFARLSGDYNPMHLDPIAARREMFGAVVVHGMNAVLTGLNAYLLTVHPPEGTAIVITELRAKFLAPIYLGRAVITSSAENGKSIKLTSETDGQRVLEIELTLQMRQASPPSSQPLPDHPETPRRDPRKLSTEDLNNRADSLDLYLDSGLAIETIHELIRVIGSNAVAELLALTRLVGMECPGLRSIFQAFAVTFHSRPFQAAATKLLTYRVSKYDPRFGFVTIAVNGPTSTGVISAFLRPEPKRQPSMQRVRSAIDPAEFANQHAMIIGGSRGLGETVAKIIAAGGGIPIITYFEGAEDANRVAGEIRAAGAECHALKCDVRSVAHTLDGIAALRLRPSQVYYFATPKIGLKRHAGYDRLALNEYLDVYVDGFINVCREFRARWKDPFSVFYPSTIAIDEPMGQLDEYAAAKSAGETMCRYMAERDSTMTTLVERLPRIATDQTLTLVGRPAADALLLLLPIVRRMATFASG